MGNEWGRDKCAQNFSLNNNGNDLQVVGVDENIILNLVLNKYVKMMSNLCN